MLAAKVFLIWISLLPLVMWNGSYEWPKLVWFLGGGFFICVFWLIKLIKDSFVFNFTKSDLFYLLWLIVLLISSLAGLHPLESILGGSYRHQGVLFFFVLFFVGKTISILPPSDKVSLVKLLGVVVVIETLIIIAQMFMGYTYNSRPLGTFGEPNASAGFIALSLIYFPKIWPFALIAIVLTSSRAGLLSFFVGKMDQVIPFFQRIGKAKWLLIPGLVLFIIFFFSHANLKRPRSVFEDRVLFAKFALNAFTQRPLLGYGAETGEVIYNGQFQKAEMPLSGLIVDRSHNLFLDLVMWSGVVGLTLFVAWLFTHLSKKPWEIGAWIIFSMLQPLGVSHWVLLMLILNLDFLDLKKI